MTEIIVNVLGAEAGITPFLARGFCPLFTQEKVLHQDSLEQPAEI